MSKLLRFQSTHSQGVRRSCLPYRSAEPLYFNPRTHKECDVASGTHASRIAISIHALTRSATGDHTKTEDDTSYFNPRTHKECDIVESSAYMLKGNFNPRTHKECDLSWIKRKPKRLSFQSTHSQGVRLSILSL